MAKKPKKRGRPRKYLPKTIGVTVHKFSDDEPAFKLINPIDREVIERNFKMFKKSMIIVLMSATVSLCISMIFSDGRIRSKREAIMNTPYGL